jgi:hypothetical protein
MAFWKECFNAVKSGDGITGSNRVCAVGSPGIGKTSTTPVLIKLLMDSMDTITVVHVMKTPKETSWYYEFTKNEGVISTSLHPESQPPEMIPSLRNENTYYVVDPGDFETSVNPSSDVCAKVIINASPDSKHWGNYYGKDGGGRRLGEFRYYPLWSLEELIAAAPYIAPQKLKLPSSPTALREWVMARFRRYGGVPRDIFTLADALPDSRFNRGFSCLSSEQAKMIARNEVKELNNFETSQPKSSIMGYMNCEDKKKRYKEPKVVVVSDYVVEKVWEKYMGDLWTEMLDEDDGSTMGYAFESYVRRLMLNTKQAARTFEWRLAEGAHKRKKNKGPLQERVLPKCTEVRICSDIPQAVRTSKKAGIVFHPVSKHYPLIDFGFRHGKKNFYAVQVTIAKRHSTDKEGIRALAKELGVSHGDTLTVIYAVTVSLIKTFSTTPVDIHHMVRKSIKGVTVSVIVVGIPNPKDSQTRNRTGEGGGASGGSSA